MMTKDQINPIAIICLIAALYFSFFILNDNNLPFSINCVLTFMDHWVHHWHILVIGMLPIYVAFMVFTASLIGLRLGNNIQEILIYVTCRPEAKRSFRDNNLKIL